jgi:hypothetical protein
MSSSEMDREEIYSNDKDPLEALAELRREGVTDQVDDLPEEEEVVTPEEEPDEVPEEEDGGEIVGEKGTESEIASDEPYDEAETSDKKVEEKSESAEPKKLSFKANGQDYEFTPEEIMNQFGTVFGKAMNYTQKMQAIAPYRKMISAIEEEKIDESQLNLAIDALKGNKQAIKQLMEKHDLTPFDLDDEDNGSQPYQPNVYGKDVQQLEIEEVVRTISSDPEYRTTVSVVDDKWDRNSRAELAKNPKLILGLHNDIKTGIYEQVAPLAAKMKALDDNPRSDIEYYMLAGEQLTRSNQLSLNRKTKGLDAVSENNQKAQAAMQNSERATSEAEKRRAASSTRSRSDRKAVIDYLEDDDEAFDEWYKGVMSKN